MTTALYTDEILKNRFYEVKTSYSNLNTLIKLGIPLRHSNIPEDITENIVKTIIINYENDETCVWCKLANKKDKLTGDLYSYKNNISIEVKSFTSNGPSQFGPRKKFDKLYFLDLRNFLDNNIILWKVNLTNNSNEFKNIQMNKSQKLIDQCEEGRRPHISWDKIFPQIKDYCQQIYNGNFEDIFIKPEIL